MWFAFNFSSFYLWYQHDTSKPFFENCCDLLSISVLSIFDTNIHSDTFTTYPLWFAFNFSSFYLWYQLSDLITCKAAVVICFQFQFFLSLIPTLVAKLPAMPPLWFAFNFSSFYLWYQRVLFDTAITPRCDLLSISVLSIFDTNHQHLHLAVVAVVICFQFQFFLSLIPTNANGEPDGSLLWFAFNFSSFYLWYQHNLSYPNYTNVVICFQFQFFLSLIPTR